MRALRGSSTKVIPELLLSERAYHWRVAACQRSEALPTTLERGAFQADGGEAAAAGSEGGALPVVTASIT